MFANLSGRGGGLTPDRETNTAEMSPSLRLEGEVDSVAVEM